MSSEKWVLVLEFIRNGEDLGISIMKGIWYYKEFTSCRLTSDLGSALVFPSKEEAMIRGAEISFVGTECKKGNGGCSVCTGFDCRVIGPKRIC